MWQKRQATLPLFPGEGISGAGREVDRGHRCGRLAAACHSPRGRQHGRSSRHYPVLYCTAQPDKGISLPFIHIFFEREGKRRTTYTYLSSEEEGSPSFQHIWSHGEEALLRSQKEVWYWTRIQAGVLFSCDRTYFINSTWYIQIFNKIYILLAYSKIFIYLSIYISIYLSI